MAVCSSYLHTLKSQRVTICFLLADYEETWEAQTKDMLLTIQKQPPNCSAQDSTKEKDTHAERSRARDCPVQIKRKAIQRSRLSGIRAYSGPICFPRAVRVWKE